MVLVLGGAGSGRGEYCRSLGIADAERYIVSLDDAREFAEEKPSAPALSAVCARIAAWPAVVATERGMGIIPAAAAARADREANGRLNVALAELADCVVLMTAGIARVIKGSPDAFARSPVRLLAFRHGATRANREGRYAGCGSDEELCAEGREQAARGRERLAAFAARCAPSLRERLLAPRRVYVSPLRRAVQTAELLYPRAELRLVAAFREMDFARFEGRTAADLEAGGATREAYHAFLAGAACPPSASAPGESRADFCARTAAAFHRILGAEEAGAVVTVVAHGGTQMALFSRFCPWRTGGDPYFPWQTACGGFRCAPVADEGGGRARTEGGGSSARSGEEDA